MSFATAVGDLFDLFASDSTGTPETALSTAGVVRVFKGEPTSGQAPKPCFVTVAANSSTPTLYLVDVRVYSSFDAPDPQTAHTRLLAVIDALEPLITEKYGPYNWEIGVAEELGAYVATSTLERVRNL